MRVLSRFACIILVLAMVFSMAGCGVQKTDSGNPGVSTGASNTPQNSPQASATQPSETSPAEPIKLTLWDYMSSDEDSRVLRPILEKWAEENPNIIIERDFVSVEDHKIKLKTSISVNSAPDIFISWGGGFSKPFVDAGKVLQLDDYISDDLKSKFIPAYNEAMTYDGKLYGLPFNGWVGILFCNSELFEKNGIAYPETFDDLLSAVGKFREKGINPLAVGVNETWTAALYHNVIALRTAGSEASMSALTDKGSFNTPEMKDSITKLSQLIKANAFMDGHMGLNYDETRSQFKQGQVAMIFDGSWFAGECETDDCMVKGKVVPKKFPVITGGKGKATEYLGGSIDCFMVGANTKYPKEAVKALEYICFNHSTQGYYNGLGMPVYKDEFDNTKLDRVTAEINDLVKDAEKYQLAWDTVLSEGDTQILLELVADVFTGKTTPEMFAEKMQKINDAK